jgi:hypothetical protein
MGAALALVAGVSSNASANTVIDLMTAGSTSGVLTSADGDLFRVDQIDPASTGTGFIDSFLRIQQNGQERGYNTDDLSPAPLDSKAGNFTHSIVLSDITTVTVGGVEYYRFILDINQNGTELLSLNQVQIFSSSGDPGNGCTVNDATATQFATLNTGSCGLTQIFTMSSYAVAGRDYELQLNYALNSGSGSGDYNFLVAKSAFQGVAPTSNIVLFSQFGAPNGTLASNDGFEEWWVVRGTPGGTPPVPEPASLLLFGMGLGLVARHARRMRARA